MYDISFLVNCIPILNVTLYFICNLRIYNILIFDIINLNFFTASKSSASFFKLNSQWSIVDNDPIILINKNLLKNILATIFLRFKFINFVEKKLPYKNFKR